VMALHAVDAPSARDDSLVPGSRSAWSAITESSRGAAPVDRRCMPGAGRANSLYVQYIRGCSVPSRSAKFIAKRS
jgi:hypothetical protein